MRLQGILVAAVLLCGPVSAQQVTFHPDPVLDCLDDATTPSMRHACIGTAANLCMIDTQGGSSTPVMGACLNSELDWWDSRLNTVYGKLMTQYADQPGLAERLRAMQRNWIPYRDARCDFEFAQWDGGTGQGPALAACLMTATAEQTLVLEEHIR